MFRFLTSLLIGVSLISIDTYAVNDGPSGKSEISLNKKTDFPALRKTLLEQIKLANAGDEQAQIFVAETLRDNHAVHTWYRVWRNLDLSKWGDVVSKAKNNFAFSYLIRIRNGAGLSEEDKAKYFQWLNEPISNIEAGEREFLLAYCYQHGIGVDMDTKKAFELYKAGADLKYPAAINNLGFYYEYGKGVDKDKKKAFEHYKEAADLGHAMANNNLGLFYYSGIGVDKDEKKAFELYKEAAALGSVWAIGNLGFCYRHGKGVDKDEKKAFELYKEGAALGDVVAIGDLAICYEDGIGVDKETLKALNAALHSTDCRGSLSMANQFLKPDIKFAKDPSKSGLYQELANMGYVRPKESKKNDCDLDNLVDYHYQLQKVNDPNSTFKKNPLPFLYELHKPIAEFGLALQGFLNKLISNEFSSSDKEIINLQQQFVMPTGFMMANLNPDQELVVAYNSHISCNIKPKPTLEGLEWLNELPFSIIELGGQKFYNVGIEAVKLGLELEDVLEKFGTIKGEVDMLIELAQRNQKTQIKLMSKMQVMHDFGMSNENIKFSKPKETYLETETRMQSHKQFLGGVMDNLKNVFNKTAPNREKDFLESIGGKWN